MKRFIKNNLKVFVAVVISGIVFTGIGVYAANTYLAHDISYTPSNENFDANNVEDALNELYGKIDNNYYLYKDGNEYEEITGGWNVEIVDEGCSPKHGIAQKNDKNIYLSFSSNNCSLSQMRTNNKINLSNYNKIYVKYFKTGTLGDTKQLLVNGEEKTTITLGYHIDEFNIIDFNDNVSIGNWYSNDYIIEVWAK